MTKTMMMFAALTAAAAPVPALAATLNLSATNVSESSATYAFEAGSYTVSLVSDVYTAWSARDITRNAEPWVGYYRYTIGDQTVVFNPKDNARYATQEAALAAYSEGGPLALYFAVPTTVTFAISDAADSFGDNAGGLSLDIAVVPEPATWAMMALGFFRLGAVLRRRRRAPVVAMA